MIWLYSILFIVCCAWTLPPQFLVRIKINKQNFEINLSATVFNLYFIASVLLGICLAKLFL